MKNNTKDRRDKLIEKIAEIKKYISATTQNNQTGELLRYLAELENDVRGRKFGLVFEEHSEWIDDKLATSCPVLTEDRELFIDKGGLVNYLIEGDNLASLQLLAKTHKKNIDIIYIDPPYNTGNQKGQGFIYDDKFVDPSDSFKHSKWSSFIYKRLLLAKDLLTTEGVIFIQIDDNEYANLKLLCDQIFGEENHLGTIIQNKGNAQNDAKNIQKNHEYILAYARKRQFINGKEKPLLYLSQSKTKKVLRDAEGRCYTRGSGIVTGGQGGTLNARPNLGYTIYYNEKTDDKIAVADYDVDLAKKSNDESQIYTEDERLISSGYVKIRPPKKQNRLGCWTWALDKFNTDKDLIEIIKTKNGYGVYKKDYITETEATEHEVDISASSKSIINYSSGAGTSTLIKLVGEKSFNNPKNLEMMKYLISLYKNKTNPLILDFFAGSGTTGQAVLEMNAEDEESNRRFILCTSNDENICREVTYPRMKAAFYTSDTINGSLKYYKVDFIDINERVYYEYADELSLHVRELVELENGIDFDHNNEIAIKLTDGELEQFLCDDKAMAFCKRLYLGHDVLTNGEQDAILREKNVKVNVIPNYYYHE